jgi:hypothetical protein
MNTQERKDRFTEIMTTVELAPDSIESDEEVEALMLPNMTLGLSDAPLNNAILSEAFRGNEQFKVKLISILSNTSMKSIMDKTERDETPNQDDLFGFAISANILWAEGQADLLFKTLGLLGQTCSHFDLEIPEMATIILRPQVEVMKFSNTFSPMELLEDNISVKEAIKKMKKVAKKTTKNTTKKDKND